MLNTRIESHLNANKVTAREAERNIQTAHSLVMYGEMHVGLEKKTRFFADIIRSGRIRYHASEYFLNTVSYGGVVNDYLHGRVSSTSLPGRARALAPVLNAVRQNISNYGLVFAGSTQNNTISRDRPLFINFQSGHSLHLRAGRFIANDMGHFHIDGDHTSRIPPSGIARKITQLLIDEGFNVGVVRLVVDVSSTSSVTSEGFNFSA